MEGTGEMQREEGKTEQGHNQLASICLPAHLLANFGSDLPGHRQGSKQGGFDQYNGNKKKEATGRERTLTTHVLGGSLAFST